MVTFDSQEIKKYIAKVRLFSGFSTGAAVVAICSGLFSAVATGHLEEHAYVVVATWIIACISVVALVVFFTLLKLTEKRLKECVISIFVIAMEENSDVYTGGGEIALLDEYEGDKITLSRQNTFKKIVFDLSGVEKSTRTYSSFGIWIWQYLEGYYFLHGSEGISNVTITEKIENEQFFDTLTLVSGGKHCCKRPEKNYFLKRGLIK